MFQNNMKQRMTWEEFHGPNLGYVLELYDQYVKDPESLDPDLKGMFDDLGAPPGEMRAASETQGEANFTAESIEKIASAIKLAEDIRTYGHLNASVNPLRKTQEKQELFPLAEYGLTKQDVEKIPASVLCKDAPKDVTNGLEAIQYLKNTYKKSISFEFDHVHIFEERNWLMKKIESGELFTPKSKEKLIEVLRRLTEVEGLEQFLHKTFVGQKRFSIEGLDALVPMLDDIIAESVSSGTTSINIGMAHRGRLNVLAHVLGKPYEIIFSEFQHAPNKDLVPSEGSIGINYGWTGDVKYHLGADRQIQDEQTKAARITLANNPSHLEFIDPIVEGSTRAAQETRTESGYPVQDVKKSLAILIHGDAAFPGEGIVSETLNLSQLKGYQVGGAIHIIANNMIGFTTESNESRSTKYASDLAKGFEIPIVHVNADDPEACLSAVQLAIEYRETFNKDFLIDLIGYRRFGHNEMDEPSATQPMLYDAVRKHPTVKNIFAEKLITNGTIEKETVDKIQESVVKRLEEAYRKVPAKKEDMTHEIVLPEPVSNGFPEVDTSVEFDVLRKINEELVSWPEDFNVFGKLKRILERRAKAFDDDRKVDWSLAEALAFASILKDGTPVRMTGQDSERGTFAHRNLVLHDSKTGDEFIALHRLADTKASFAVHNSPLSEGSVLGFEYGYNVSSPETMVIWEAQFGDFANAAQVYFDQFISAGRAKWGQKSGLVVLLPHGYEGQGPEHSSGRTERFLQLAAENNWTVANLTSAAQYFHVLRRQAKMLLREEIRPLIIMTPKSLLRNPNTVSEVQELSDSNFKPVYEMSGLSHQYEKVTRLVLSSGKVSIDISDYFNKMETEKDWLHIARVEELYPFPAKHIKAFFGKLPNLEEIVWVQEEPQNMGAWNYIEPYLREIAPKDIKVRYIGRRRRSSPAEGDPTVHKKEQERIVSDSLTRKN
ncbi:2-oxoglutarate dehydrogenase E1 component [Bacillus swezeyi]|uniref:2-oxoglutarate dehydrogenase E1 component n=1 Tax=Bacillus swezeyi TaxID=1925020 RepID=A0A1R1RF00_9BACI|nr:2-oxoglutarate dehydrogenase E1 component [Bacillus swezeyi]MEC1259944.1 2-oxoglutarate dehydrogenase E1 component [Bacillus swezeyi]MED2929824.1 2-oxoglutarate dehydrogenase E1 component [Bacillus swezeyi]MED2963149.1 2-oxoglutarate dehydrogenase E1 component [Bacillus swezeyi]MED3073100.1 2-oxoglutarate dehydrogenase E1 component [Bacillus swezeyi]MED3082821.1 2-oxoglutarate dehydrogenase E1 component [Bacillus swezeyi]